MRHKLRADRPAISGNSRRRSADNISTRLAVAFILLRVDNGAANVPIKQDQFAVGRNRSLDLRGPDPLFDALDKAVIELCTSLLHNWRKLRFRPGVHAVRQRIASNLRTGALFQLRFAMRARKIAENYERKK